MYRVMRAGSEILPGLEAKLERVVDESLVTLHVGGEGVFGTPFMILLMEQAAHSAVAPYLAPDQTTVGYEVHVRHLAPTLPGQTVVTTGVLKEVNGLKLLFEVTCHEGEKLVGVGTHKRAIVPARA
jgi:fluoroacetyl-CoA thioesterase